MPEDIQLIFCLFEELY